MRTPAAILFLILASAGSLAAQTFDLVLANGRVMDPESGTDGIRYVGIRGGRIESISTTPLQGRTMVDAQGMVVAPGFIDLHSHGQDDENYRFKAHDGVTTALELDVGVSPVAAWYAERKDAALVNYGATVGHIPVAMRILHDTDSFLPRDLAMDPAATPAELK